MDFSFSKNYPCFSLSVNFAWTSSGVLKLASLVKYEDMPSPRLGSPQIVGSVPSTSRYWASVAMAKRSLLKPTRQNSEAIFSRPLFNWYFFVQISIYLHIFDAFLWFLQKRYEKNLIYPILNFGCGPIILRYFFLRWRFENRASFSYFDDICHIIRRLLPYITIQIAIIWHIFKEETLFYDIPLNFGCGSTLLRWYFLR